VANTDKKHKAILKVVVVGGGFAGVKSALGLIDEPAIDLTLISDAKDFRYHPTLYRAATGGYHVQTLIPLSDIFENKPIRIVYERAEKIDRQNKKIITFNGQAISYDKVIFALGSVTNYFHIKGLEQYSYGIKTFDEASRLKEHLHKQLITDHLPDINYVVVGGGPTGVELAGALSAYIKHLLKTHKIKHRAVHIDLIEAAPRLMPSMPKDLSRSVARRLRRLGIKLYLDKKVDGETADNLIMDGELLKSRTVIWTAGVSNNPFFKDNGFRLNQKGLAEVNEYLETEPDIFVLGDNAATPYSGMAQTAVHNGVFIAENIKRQLQSRPLKAYQPKKPVYVTPAGPQWAAVLWGNIRLYGYVGWLLRRSADFIAYHDIETWWKASRQWLAENIEEESCPYCVVNDQTETTQS
jgi:NADH dehydrogenase